MGLNDNTEMDENPNSEKHPEVETRRKKKMSKHCMFSGIKIILSVISLVSWQTFHSEVCQTVE